MTNEYITNCTVCSLQQETWHSFITTYEYYIIKNDKVLSIFGFETKCCFLRYTYILRQIIILNKLILKKCVTLIYNCQYFICTYILRLLLNKIRKRLGLMPLYQIRVYRPVPAAWRSKSWVWGRSLLEIVGSNPTAGMDVCLLWVLSVVRLRTFDELITHPEESYRLWCVVVCDLETSRMRRPWPTLGRSATRK